MKKLLSMLVALAIFAVVGLISSKAYAVDNDNAYVVVKCTVAISVDIDDSQDVAGLAGNAPSAIIMSTKPIHVDNTGVGSITHWSLKIAAAQTYSLDGATGWTGTDTYNVPWTFGATKTDIGLNQCTLAAVFEKQVPEPTLAGGDFADNDVLTASDQIYERSNGKFGPVAHAYTSDIIAAGDHGYNMVSNPKSTLGDGPIRDLYFLMTLPSAVTDSNYRMITVTITAAPGI